MSNNALEDIPYSHAYYEWSPNMEAYSQKLKEMTLDQLEIESKTIYSIHYSHDSMSSSERRAKIGKIRAIESELFMRMHIAQANQEIKKAIWKTQNNVITLIQKPR